MPFGDRTGPAGAGPMTGRSAGYCAGQGMPGYANPVPGRGFWRRGAWGFSGRGGGRGQRNWFYATGLPGWARGGFRPGHAPHQPYTSGQSAMSKEQELEMLKEQADKFQEGLDGIKKRISDLETGE